MWRSAGWTLTLGGLCAALEWEIYRRVTMITIVGGVALVWSFLMMLYTTLQQYKRDETPIGPGDEKANRRGVDKWAPVEKKEPANTGVGKKYEP